MEKLFKAIYVDVLQISTATNRILRKKESKHRSQLYRLQRNTGSFRTLHKSLRHFTCCVFGEGKTFEVLSIRSRWLTLRSSLKDFPTSCRLDKYRQAVPNAPYSTVFRPQLRQENLLRSLWPALLNLEQLRKPTVPPPEQRGTGHHLVKNQKALVFVAQTSQKAAKIPLRGEPSPHCP